MPFRNNLVLLNLTEATDTHRSRNRMIEYDLDLRAPRLVHTFATYLAASMRGLSAAISYTQEGRLPGGVLKKMHNEKFLAAQVEVSLRSQS